MDICRHFCAPVPWHTRRKLSIFDGKYKLVFHSWTFPRKERRIGGKNPQEPSFQLQIIVNATKIAKTIYKNQPLKENHSHNICGLLQVDIL